MSLKVITTWEEGLGTVSKGIVADTQEDYKILHQAILDAANGWMIGQCPPTLLALRNTLLKNPPAPPISKEEHF